MHSKLVKLQTLLLPLALLVTMLLPPPTRTRVTPTVSPAPTATAPAATATPASVIPRTADSFPLALLIGLAIVSCGALGILYTAKKRRK